MRKRYPSLLELIEIVVLLGAIAVLASLLLIGTSQVYAGALSTAQSNFWFPL